MDIAGAPNPGQRDRHVKVIIHGCRSSKKIRVRNLISYIRFLVECGAVLLGDWCVTFRDSVALPPARVEISNEGHSPGDISTLEDETVMLSRNV